MRVNWDICLFIGGKKLRLLYSIITQRIKWKLVSWGLDYEQKLRRLVSQMIMKGHKFLMVEIRMTHFSANRTLLQAPEELGTLFKSLTLGNKLSFEGYLYSIIEYCSSF